MCEQASVTLPADPAAPRQARRCLADWLERWEVTGDVVDTALLLATEAVTNATVHAGTPSTLSAALTADELHVSVADGRPASGPPTSADGSAGSRGSDGSAAGTPRLEPRRANPWQESGRGLLLIDRLADRWDVAEVPGGKAVRMWWQVQRLPQQRAACTCR